MAKIKDMDDLEIDKDEKEFIKSADMKRMERKPGGRPKKDESDRACSQIYVNVTKSEKKKIEEAAKELGVSVSALCKISLSKFLKE